MKITKNQLTQLIREELEGLLNEQFGEPQDLGAAPLVRQPDSFCGPGGCVKKTYRLPKAIGKASGKFISHLGSYLGGEDADVKSTAPAHGVEDVGAGLASVPDVGLKEPKSTLTPKEFVKSAPKRDDGKAIVVKVNKRKSELDEQDRWLGGEPPWSGRRFHPVLRALGRALGTIPVPPPSEAGEATKTKSAAFTPGEPTSTQPKALGPNKRDDKRKSKINEQRSQKTP